MAAKLMLALALVLVAATSTEARRAHANEYVNAYFSRQMVRTYSFIFLQVTMTPITVEVHLYEEALHLIQSSLTFKKNVMFVKYWLQSFSMINSTVNTHYLFRQVMEHCFGRSFVRADNLKITNARAACRNQAPRVKLDEPKSAAKYKFEKITEVSHTQLYLEPIYFTVWSFIYRCTSRPSWLDV